MAKKEFQAESKKLMDMMINSIYTNKEIFLRELISNASDAIDKLYYKSLTDTSVGMNKSDFRILITRDKENRILTVEDNGIGMTKAELEENLGTIAHSGSLDFKQDNKDENIDIIGQFGVGFYSSFMVADKVTVISKAYGSDEAWQWESSGVDGYEMTPAEKDTAGTQIILHIKPDTETDHYDNFLDEYGIVAIVKKYSDYVRYPIQMEREKSRQKPEPDPKPEDYKPEWETYTELETLNSMIPIWKKQKSEVTDEEYNAFYKDKFGDYADPARGRPAVKSAIEHGYFGADAYIDNRTDTLVVRGTAPQPKKPAPAPAPKPQPAAEDEYAALLRQLREVNDAIPDPVMSQKISRLEEVSGRIFALAQKDPDKKAQLQKFMNYYLPTALKLLNTYASLSRQAVEGTNITEAKHSIERSMDLLVTAFENQLDKLFQSDALDVTTDIAALEGMLNMDGLTDSAFGK